MDNFLEQEFGLGQYEFKKLNGYENTNYLVKTRNERLILKTYNYSEALLYQIKEENAVLNILKNKAKGVFPSPVNLKNGAFTQVVSIEGKEKIVRLLTFLDGEFLGDINDSKLIHQSLGTFLAKLDIMLQDLDSYVFRARQWEWDLQYFRLNKKYIEDIANPRDRNIVLYFFQQFEENVEPLFPFLRKQIIHNDANEWNILVKNNSISGLIDFGDLAHSFLISELAIAITYSCFDKDNPIDCAVTIIEAYHKVLPLEEKEVDVLYYLIAARLCTSVCNSSHSAKIDPDNKYASVSSKPAWKMLYQWISINPINAKNRFRKALDFEIEDVPEIRAVVAQRNKYISKICSLSYNQPIHIARSAFQYMYDVNGNTFLDAYNNIPHVGHSHPKVVAAGQKQMAILNTNTRYLYDELAEYAEKLLAKFPDSLTKVFFVNSGSAATDLAIRMANNHTGHKLTMVMELGYHGNTQTAIDISDYKFSNPKGQGQKQHIIKTPIPNAFLGRYSSQEVEQGTLYAKDAVLQIENSDQPIAAFISEPILGCAGQVPLAKGYLKEVYPAIRAQGGVCISDEVQTGFGRLGDYFWGYEAQNVVPDMVILGKPIANGHPMGAVVCTDEIVASFEKGVEFFSSFGGNPVSCAIASSVLDVIDEEGLQENAKVVGDYYKTLLKDLLNKYPCIVDVRGSGLFVGVELMEDDQKTPSTKLASHLKNKLRENFILVSTDGPFNNIIKSKPPLCFTKENANTVVDCMDKILSEFYMHN